LAEKVEVRSENAHHVILSYQGKIFYVSMVRVNHRKENEKYAAIFHAREATGSDAEDITMEIPQNLYEALLKYASLDNRDLMLVLQVEGDNFKWGFTKESELKPYLRRDNTREYVV
jgi:hypothetical protein